TCAASPRVSDRVKDLLSELLRPRSTDGCSSVPPPALDVLERVEDDLVYIVNGPPVQLAHGAVGVRVLVVGLFVKRPEKLLRVNVRDRRAAAGQANDTLGQLDDGDFIGGVADVVRLAVRAPLHHGD